MVSQDMHTTGRTAGLGSVVPAAHASMAHCMHLVWITQHAVLAPEEVPDMMCASCAWRCESTSVIDLVLNRDLHHNAVLTFTSCAGVSTAAS